LQEHEGNDRECNQCMHYQQCCLNITHLILK
jgi:hypothetical protein